MAIKTHGAGRLWISLLCALWLIGAFRGTPHPRASAADGYDVGVFYFSDWNPTFGASNVKSTERLYDRPNDWWGGVKDHVTAPGPWGYGPFPEREPVLGWYNDSEQGIMDQHILQASSRGIDHFAFYYYWKDQGGGDRPGQNVYNFVQSPHKDLMKFYLYVIADGTWPASDWNSLMVPKLISFMKDPSYKRTPDGRPIVGFYGNFDVRLGGTEQWKQALLTLRSEAQKAGLPNPLLIVNGYRNLAEQSAKGYDGFLPLNLAGIGLEDNAGIPEDYTTSYPSAWNDFVYASYPAGSGFENYENYLFIPGGLSGFDPRPWRAIGYGDHNGVETYNYSEPSPAKFRVQVQNVKSYLDTHPRSMNMATFYAWNEFGEGGGIEPTTMYGYGYLNALQEVFGLSNAAYRTKVSAGGLPDLDPQLRLEFAPEHPTFTAGQTLKVKGTVTNLFSKTVGKAQISLNAGGAAILSSSGTFQEDVKPGDKRTVEFTIRTPQAADWSKLPLTVTANYSVNGRTGSQSMTTHAVQTPAVYGVIEPVNRPVFAGETVPVKISIRDYSLQEAYGTYQVGLPDGWSMVGKDQGSFALSPYAGGVETNRRFTQTVNVVVPPDVADGTANLKLAIMKDGATAETVTPVKVGNYVRNPSFESDYDNDGLANSWQKVTGKETVTRSTYAMDGSYSQQFAGDGYGNGISQEWFKVIPGQTYVVEAWVKVDSGIVNIVEAEADAGFQTFLGYNLQQKVTAGDWQKFTLTLTAKANAANASIRFLTWADGHTAAYVDRVVFKPAP